MNKVVEFINRRFKDTNARWTSGNCYWFAQILLMRFPYLKLYYLPIDGHFIVGDSERFYDYSGEVNLDEAPIEWDYILAEEPNWAERILKACRD